MSPVHSQLYKLEEQLTARIKVIGDRWDKLQDAHRPYYEEEDRTGEDMPERGKRIWALCARAEKTYGDLEWRLEQSKKAVSIIEEIEGNVQEYQHKPERDKRIRERKKALNV
jgi:hypothetical protein